MVEEIMTLFLECICDTYCKCEKCMVDDAPCYLEDDLKKNLKKRS